MGKEIQTEDYVIVFTASWETFEDTLLFFHSDLQESLLREPGPMCGIGRAVGVHAGQLNDDLSFREYYEIQNDALCPALSDEAIKPSLVHLLHLDVENEVATHMRLSRQFDAERVALVNPYGPVVAQCDSKSRMSEILRKRGVPTPATRFVSRFTEDKTEAVDGFRRQRPDKDLFAQPDRGTEATGCVFLKRHGPTLERMREPLADQDLVVRERVGNLKFEGHDFVVRINATYDGRTFAADSGYCMVGTEVVSASRGAVRRSVNEVFDQLRLRDDEISRIKATACAAFRAVSGEGEPPRLAGVDLVLEKRDELTAYVIDINPRPVAVGSRIIGSDAIGLGDHFWGGIQKLRLAE